VQPRRQLQQIVGLEKEVRQHVNPSRQTFPSMLQWELIYRRNFAQTESTSQGHLALIVQQINSAKISTLE